MKQGVMVSISKDGIVSRKVIGAEKSTELEVTTPEEEILLFSELSFGPYAVVVDAIRYRTNQIPVPGADHFGELNMEEFQEVLALKEDLTDTFEQEDLLHGTLTRTALEDAVKPDDGTAMYVVRTTDAILNTLTAIMKLQFTINDVLDDLKNGKEPELDGLGQMDLTQVVSFGKGESSAYLVRSPSEYYRLMLFWFLERNPQIAWCECCGRFFIPKTKKKTLYCDRVIKDGKTCKVWGPVLKHRLAAQKDRVLEEFDRAKKRMYKRFERAKDKPQHTTEKDLSFSAYYDWLERATQARDRYLRGEISEEEILKILCLD